MQGEMYRKVTEGRVLFEEAEAMLERFSFEAGVEFIENWKNTKVMVINLAARYTVLEHILNCFEPRDLPLFSDDSQWCSSQYIQVIVIE